MTPAVESPNLTGKEMAMIAELLESERNRLLVQIHHTDHRLYREALGERLQVVEDLARRFAPLRTSSAQ
jgi:hypothetical protein